MTVSSTSTTPTHGRAGPGPAELGVGARFSVHPAADDVVEVITGALAEVGAAGLAQGLLVETDDVSTYVGAVAEPAEERLARYLAAVVAATARRTRSGHVVAHVLLSRGCPGETTCDLTATGLRRPAPVVVPTTGVRAVAQWSLYPLLDGPGGPGDPAGGTDHMAHIASAVDAAHRRGTATAPAHYATRLSGDLADVLATAVDAWSDVGRDVAHVVSHLTVSLGSPTPAPAS